ncbi:MAG: undecaprenyl/decaprenyl-phosphate alpha-N-acetylglucosaminyl 1-phosphate transferase, partial [Muribaculaceae bacterium]|nr:undecaprenyl/decaprenyl-phosphate alpha-N-acetylglucosaminyl 1-phosphate transferase [Muribaculaceae bacterium]
VYLHENAFILGFTPLLLPFYDTISVVFYRLLKGKNPFKADDNHFTTSFYGLDYRNTQLLLLS